MKLITNYWQRTSETFYQESRVSEPGKVGFRRELALVPVRLYKRLISPYIKPRCIYYPTCSEYFIQAVTEYGVGRGSLKGIYRILRCNPFAKGGYDPLT